MAFDKQDAHTTPLPLRTEPDPSAGFRAASATMGLILIGIGSILTLLLFWRLYQTFLDPRPLVAQVDRWEFVIRGKATDALIPVERPVVTGSEPDEDYDTAAPTSARAVRRPENEVEAVAQIAGRVGSKAARPAAMLIMLILLGILVRILLGLIDTGGRLVYNAAGDRELLQRLVRELRNRP